MLWRDWRNSEMTSSVSAADFWQNFLDLRYSCTNSFIRKTCFSLIKKAIFEQYFRWLLYLYFCKRFDLLVLKQFLYQSDQPIDYNFWEYFLWYTNRNMKQNYVYISIPFICQKFFITRLSKVIHVFDSHILHLKIIACSRLKSDSILWNRGWTKKIEKKSKYFKW
jgi:hypothetical protein